MWEDLSRKVERKDPGDDYYFRLVPDDYICREDTSIPDLGHRRDFAHIPELAHQGAVGLLNTFDSLIGTGNRGIADHQGWEEAIGLVLLFDHENRSECLRLGLYWAVHTPEEIAIDEFLKPHRVPYHGVIQ